MTDLGNHLILAKALQAMLPPGLAVAVRSIASEQPMLLPGEEAAVVNAVPKRRREFEAGRAAAREAMEALGREPSAVLQGSDRAPIWPEGLRGSITHDDDLAVAVVADYRSELSPGVDVEPVDHLEPGLHEHILTETEQAIAMRAVDPSRLALSAFSAKEAVFKAQYPLTRSMLKFHDLEILKEDSGISSGVKVKGAAGRARVMQVEADGVVVSLALCPVVDPNAAKTDRAARFW